MQYSIGECLKYGSIFIGIIITLVFVSGFIGYWIGKKIGSKNEPLAVAIDKLSKNIEILIKKRE